MLVLVQFPIVDGRVFARDSGAVDRPDWGAPRVSPLRAHRDFVRGFGRVAVDQTDSDPAWVDEGLFVQARRAVQFPALQHRHFEGRNGGRWMVGLRSRRLLSDGEAAARVELGFTVKQDRGRAAVAAEEVLQGLLGLPAVVPGARPETATDLILLGRSLARRYAVSTTRHGRSVAGSLVAPGAPLVVAEIYVGDEGLPVGAIDVRGATPTRAQLLHLATTSTRHGGVATWYLRPNGSWPRVERRNVRLAVLRQHVQEEALDRVLRWVATGALEYVPQSPAGDRLEDYINTATKVVNRESYLGVDRAELRAALDAVTTAPRAVEVRRRARLDGMRRQVRLKAERFLAERDARRPSVNVSGRVVQVGDQIFSGQFYGPVAGTVYAERMENSFNAFAAGRPDDELQARVADLHEQVAVLVARLKEVAPDEAGEVAGTLATFTDELAKDEPNRTTLKALGRGIVDVAKKVAEVTTPVATAVSAVLKVFGIAA